MDDSGKTPEEHFIIQRRNFVLMCVVIIFYHAGNFEFKEFNILGNVTTVGHPEVVLLALAVFFFYFFWRYNSACFDVRGIQQVIQSYVSKRNMNAFAWAVQIAERHTNLIKGEGFHVLECQYERGFVGPKVPKLFWYQLEPSAHYDYSSVQREKLHSLGIIKLEGCELIRLKISTFVSVAVRESGFAEYVFPYVLAIWGILEIIGLELTEKLLFSIGLYAS